MTFTEYEKLVKEVELTRHVANSNVVRLAKGICDYMPYDSDFSPATREKIDILYKKLGEAIETAKNASDVADYYRNDERACVDVVLDRLNIKGVDVKEILKEEKEDEYI
jgi:hypothetical protein